jgi:DNA-binding response OmpR family regulator
VRVLIVSPDPAERQRAASALQLRQDVDVVEAAGGSQAATHLRDATFDVLVVDGDLQPKGGFSWLYELRADAQLHDRQRPPAVVMTAREQDRFLADWSGAEAIVRKPVDGFEVADRVAELAGHAPTSA